MVLRPPGVAILLRKPCLFLRFRLLGWNVRFIPDLVSRQKECKVRKYTEPSKDSVDILYSDFFILHSLLERQMSNLLLIK